MDSSEFVRRLTAITRFIGERPLDAALEDELNRQFPPTAQPFTEVFAACREAIADGWMCKHEAGGIRYGRVVKPGPETQGFSVDVVDMNDVRGPHHRHPHGEIDMIMPLDVGAQFDGRGAGWRVYAPDSAHFPTVSGGRALVLYLLPAGAIEFTKS